MPSEETSVREKEKKQKKKTHHPHNNVRPHVAKTNFEELKWETPVHTIDLACSDLSTKFKRQNLAYTVSRK